MLPESDLQIIEQCSHGLAIILVAPKDQEFNNGTMRLMIEDGEVFTISDEGEINKAVIRVEEITKKLRNGEWEISEAFNEDGVLRMEPTKKIYENFMKRLQFHYEGEGVKDHITADPIFIIQKLDRVYGLDFGYADKSIIRNIDGESHWDDVEELVENLDDEELQDLLDEAECDSKDDFLMLYEYDQMNALERLDYENVYYIEQWLYVCSHFTREAAEAFIKRKKHDYDELRIYVESQIHCWEYNMIIRGLLSGEIGLIEQSDRNENA